MITALKVQGTINSLIIMALCTIKQLHLVYITQNGCILQMTAV